jgi:hypothetical protein
MYDNSTFSLKLARAVRTREPMFSFISFQGGNLIKNVLLSQCRDQFMKSFSVSSTSPNQRRSGGSGGNSIKYNTVTKYDNYGNTSIASTTSIIGHQNILSFCDGASTSSFPIRSIPSLLPSQSLMTGKISGLGVDSFQKAQIAWIAYLRAWVSVFNSATLARSHTHKDAHCHSSSNFTPARGVELERRLISLSLMNVHWMRPRLKRSR